MGERRQRIGRAALLFALCGLAAGQTVNVTVDAGSSRGAWKHSWRYFGYDEPNYTYMKHGRKLVAELAALAPEPVYLRTHHLLCTGDGTPGLKWGSTNAYTEDAAGRAVYDWTILDRIFDTYAASGARPMVEIGFMPRALSTVPDPYTRVWPKPDDGKGWSYPPRDYEKWGELVYRWVRHSVERYGAAQVRSWYWEVWNEPDISYWRGTPEEYCKLYDSAVKAVKRALPEARVGGPATTGPGSAKAAAFLRAFLEHCRRSGAPLDFVSFHAKGRPAVVDGHVRMGTAKQLTDVERGLEILSAFPEFRKLPVILSESDPEGCAACSARTHPQNAYRNTALYPANTAVVIRGILDLEARYGANIEGILTWAFEFENQPWFDGFRTLATNGVDKPVLNLFRMLGLMGGERVELASDGAIPAEEIRKSGVAGRPAIDGMATRGGRELSVLLWNYHDDEGPAPDAAVRLAVRGLPGNAGRVQVRHYRIDARHSNAYAAWKEMGSPQQPTPEQYARLEAAGQLALLAAPEWRQAEDGGLNMQFPLPRHGLSLLQIAW